MSEVADSGVISRYRFLIVDGDREVLSRIERYLLMLAAPKVYTATSPLLALRIMQDRRTPVDCVICPNKQGRISGLEFLQNLREGRWTGGNLRNVKFILVMKEKDEATIQIADSYRVNGYIIGELDRDVVTASVVKALTRSEAESPLKKYPVAHLRIGGFDAIFVPFDKSFAALAGEEQQSAIEAVQSAAALLRLGGAVIPVWQTDDGGMGFIANTQFHSALSGVTMDYVRNNLNRELSLAVDLPARETEASNHARGSVQEPVQRSDSLGYPPSIAGASDGAERIAELASRVSKGASADGSARKDTHTELGNNDQHEDGFRVMTSEDVGKVILAFRQLGPENFVKAFMRSQNVVQTCTGSAIIPLMRESFFSIGLLRKSLFPEVNLRNSRAMLGDLTLALDQALMRSVQYISKSDGLFSVNLNIQSTLTKGFEAFIAQAPRERMMIEFRQPNIVEYYDEFVLARGVLESNGVKFAVDRIFPDTLGLMNLDFIGAKVAKIHWSNGARDVLNERIIALRRIIETGVTLVMSRVDDPAALKVCRDLGIEQFQGFLVDDLMKQAAE